MSKVAIQNCSSYNKKTLDNSLNGLFEKLGMNPINPFGSFIQPGDTVFIKPNWVAHKYRESSPVQDDIYCIITHPQLIEAIADRVAIALGGKGKIIVGDNPSIDANFDELMKMTGLLALKTKYDVPCNVLDLRPMRCSNLNDYGDKRKMVSQQGDPLGTRVVNLGKESMLYDVNPFLFRGVFNQRFETIKHHFGSRQEYGISQTIASSDVFISLPKMKTHHKTGATLNLKGLVGMNTIKNYLVHWRIGWPNIGGDEYPSYKDWLFSKTQKIVKRGAWAGNDTIWRMVVDLYKTFLKVCPSRTFSIVDGILGGEGEGPFLATSKKSKTLVGGQDLLSVDLVTAHLMGFDIGQIRYLDYFMQTVLKDLREIKVVEELVGNENFFENKSEFLSYKAPASWPKLSRRSFQ